MSLLCIVVAGVVRATLPDAEFTLAWTHSVQKTRWEERYRVDAHALRLLEAYAEGSGAGMEPGPDAWRSGAGWRWRPERDLARLVLTASPFGGSYSVCTRAGCRDLRELAGNGDDPVELRPC